MSSLPVATRLENVGVFNAVGSTVDTLSCVSLRGFMRFFYTFFCVKVDSQCPMLGRGVLAVSRGAFLLCVCAHTDVRCVVWPWRPYRFTGLPHGGVVRQLMFMCGSWRFLQCRFTFSYVGAELRHPFAPERAAALLCGTTALVSMAS